MHSCTRAESCGTRHARWYGQLRAGRQRQRPGDRRSQLVEWPPSCVSVFRRRHDGSGFAGRKYVLQHWIWDKRQGRGDGELVLYGFRECGAQGVRVFRRIMNSIPGNVGTVSTRADRWRATSPALTRPHMRSCTPTALRLIGGRSGVGSAINAAGEITGWIDATGADNVFKQHAYRYSSGTVTDLGTLGGNFSFGSGINAIGQIVGCRFLQATRSRRRLCIPVA